MNVTAGTRLGPYEVVSRIGAGGMGEVWRAQDTRLDRTVAIKILPSEFAKDAQLHGRFEREAKAISQLNHPNICTLHDIGQTDGINYLVMEIVEGESLADRLSLGPLPLNEVLRLGAQIADALDTAHRAGIVHRDLKPGNVMITKSGAKLLDFGLAKPSPGPSGHPLPHAGEGQTEHKPLTQEGMVVGTFQYMSPEQLEGIEADPRTDIFALGCVLYEMATGKRAFQGNSRTSLIAAIVSSEPPPISATLPLTPPALDHVIQKCLAKDREDRWQSSHDVAAELKWISQSSQPGIVLPLVRRRRIDNRILLAIALLAIAVAGYEFWRARSTPAPRTIRAEILSPKGVEFTYSRLDSAALTVSPDGRYVTFAATDSTGKQSLWLRAIDSTAAQPIAGTEFGAAPFWSPDSRSIGFFSNGKLKRVDLAGGPPVNIADASDGRGGTWNLDGTILFAAAWRTPISAVPAAGGAVRAVTKLDESRGETTHRWPWFLPDGKHFLYLAGSHRAASTSDLNAIYLASTEGGTPKLLLRARSNVIYANGYLLFVRENILLAQRFDPGKLELRGDPIRVAEDVTYDSGFFRAAFGASSEGTLAYYTGPSISMTQLAWFDRTGKRLSLVGPPLASLQTDVMQMVRLSPDGKRVAFDMGDTSDIWILNLDRTTGTRFTTDPMNDASPVWSPDGKSIAYTSDRDVLGAIYVKPTDGLSPEKLLLRNDHMLRPTSWSKDGKYIAYEDGDPTGPETKRDIWILPLDGKPMPFIQTEFTECCGEFSPDTRWLTFMSNESGRGELYAVPFPARGEKRQLTNAGVTGYLWRGDGKEILYLGSDRALYSIKVSGNDFSTPTLLFKPESPLLAGDITADGTRILGAEAQSMKTSPIELVTGWVGGVGR